MNAQDHTFFHQNGYLLLGQLFSLQDATRFRAAFDHDRKEWRAMWHSLDSAYQTVNCDPLITWPGVDEIIRRSNPWRSVVPIRSLPAPHGPL